MISTDLKILEARTSDSLQLASLLTQLGYPSVPEQIPVRLSRLNVGTAVALVAERNDVVVGLVTAHVFSSIHCDEDVAWITTLIVDRAARRQGVGRQLVTAVEEWVRSRGCDRISVTSGAHRDEAHAFYRHVGWRETGIRYSRRFAESG